jgi:hypothetical protein
MQDVKEDKPLNEKEMKYQDRIIRVEKLFVTKGDAKKNFIAFQNKKMKGR